MSDRSCPSSEDTPTQKEKNTVLNSRRLFLFIFGFRYRCAFIHACPNNCVKIFIVFARVEVFSVLIVKTVTIYPTRTYNGQKNDS